MEPPNTWKSEYLGRYTVDLFTHLKARPISQTSRLDMKCCNSGTLAKQRVCVVDKCIHKHNLLAVKGNNRPQKVNAIVDHLRSFAESTQTNKQSSLSVEEVDDHDECEEE